MSKSEIWSKVLEVEAICIAFCHSSETETHGLPHLRNVSYTAGRIASAVNEDIEAAVVAGFLHDCARQDDNGGREHAYESALMARGIIQEHYPHLEVERLYACIALHADGKVTEDMLIGSVWDADRLDLARIGIEVREEFLSTLIAKRIVAIRRYSPFSAFY